jgi:hypothetical protein
MDHQAASCPDRFMFKIAQAPSLTTAFSRKKWVYSGWHKDRGGFLAILKSILRLSFHAKNYDVLLALLRGRYGVAEKVSN